MTQLFGGAAAALRDAAFDDRHLLSSPCWAELRVFLAVAKCKSFNRAAEELGMTHPTVSRQVRRLQDVLGSQLVLSSNNGVVLTERGRELADALLSFDERISTLSQKLVSESRDAEGCVHIASGEGLAGMFIVPHLRDLGQRFPKIQVYIRNPINLLSFRDNKSDIALVFVPAVEKGIESVPVGFLHLIAVASEDYVALHGRPTKADLEKHLFVDMGYYSANTETWSSWRAAVNRGTTAHMCDNSFAYAFMVKSGLGIGLLGNYMLTDPTLVALDIGAYVKVPLHLQVATERLECRPVRIMYDWLSEVLSFRNHWLRPASTQDADDRQKTMATIGTYYRETPFAQNESGLQ